MQSSSVRVGRQRRGSRPGIGVVISSATFTSSVSSASSAMRRARRDELPREYENVRFCRDYAEVLNDPSITAVALATPAVTHFEMASAALEAGRTRSSRSLSPSL